MDYFSQIKSEGEVREIIQIGCPTWIRTMNNASKGRCVTITPSDKASKTRLFAAPAQSENHPPLN